MMKLKSILTLAIALPLLSACDLVDDYNEMVNEQMADITIYISPVAELQIDDSEIGYVHGFEECPNESVNWLFGYSHSVGGNNCIKIDPENENIKVRVINDQVNLIETWNVSRVGDAVSLTRPNGFKVREPSNQS
ncbi:hypothetical protein R7O81_22145 [Vibrio sp. Vb2977]|uniref:Lipoprotein n=5 Tax=Vibrionaceae TaxID=641 RepID=A0AA47LAJ0_VIBPH|nr:MULTISPECIES: hypothetical protein [Vibrio]MDW1464426.1 hypothetical protein [Vibrio sp. YT-16]MDW1546683.1 hypothetical protein [Vibrio sp. Vb5034]MDW1646472.1 hypothetical protein [Vibrio sp. Vb2976]MDW1682952.1 hypothetical protein [Vibrio sp. Vb2942]MDW1727090.1 hypothetical protein [Vibrio sp. Vb2909]MDW1788075.1 hypothetical protein [Vibrio sp. Vb2227]MDW1817604.1 hypothetical protein [Vibrio sp. Vb2232]MDW2238070.1 hypothetical protein [Vibrio sp. 1565-1]MDW2296342.1 hypothetical